MCDGVYAWTVMCVLEFDWSILWTGAGERRWEWNKTRYLCAFVGWNLSLCGINQLICSWREWRLFWWADHTIMVTYSLSPIKRSPRHPRVLFLTLYIHIFITIMLLCLIYICFPISLHSPHPSPPPSPAHRTCRANGLFWHPQQRVVHNPQVLGTTQ